jgi:formate-dependent phosphoribosylglycinamide formyltransferase (GAR transformylase)
MDCLGVRVVVVDEYIPVGAAAVAARASIVTVFSF